jgi:glyoxylase-like metal-dependent hydrolase (beta-lactamase superfamily II)
VALLELIDLNQERRGYRSFIGCWLCRLDGLTLLVDPGPQSTAGHLIAELKRRGVDSLDVVLLTHIHLDHAGSSAAVLSAFDGARLFCHQKGVRHMVDPARLWQGSLDNLGEVARMYAQPGPVPLDRMAAPGEVESMGIRVLPTPGHAPHHLSYLVGDVLFAGEAIATRMELPGGKSYLRPATPHRFLPDVFRASLDLLLGLEPEPDKTAFGHHGLADGVFEWCRKSHQQLDTWLDTLARHRDQSPQAQIQALLEADPHFGQGAFESLDADIQERERFYVENSLRGMREYLKVSPS